MNKFKLKNAFKGLFIVCSLAIAQVSLAQNPPELPFAYLNQFFSYELQADGQLRLGTRAFSMGSLQVVTIPSKTNTTTFQIRSGDFQFLVKNSFKIELRTPDQKNIFEQKIKGLNANAFHIQIPNKFVEQAHSLCIEQKNEFTAIDVCRRINSTTSQVSFLELSADGLRIGERGRVVLNEKMKSVLFQADAGDEGSLSVATLKRRPVPTEIAKDTNDQFYSVDFIEYEKPKMKWSEKLNYTNESFPLPYDGLLQVHQEYFVKNRKNESMSLTYYKPPTPKFVHTEEVAVIPKLSFYQLTAKTTQIDSKINSQMSYGILGMADRKLPEKYALMTRFDNWYAEGDINQIKLQTSVGSIRINNATQTTISVSGGLKKIYNPNLWLYALLRLEQSISIDDSQISSSAIAADKILNKEIQGRLQYTLFDRNRLSMVLPASAGVLLPTTMNGQSTPISYRVALGGQIRYEFEKSLGDKAMASMGIEYGLRDQSTSSVKFQEASFIYKFGAYYIY